MIDERALEAAAQALANIHQFNGVPDECRDDARRIIEAYEAALWRPIEKATRDTDRVIIDWDGDGRGQMQVCWMERHVEKRLWLNGFGPAIREADFPNAMFRTITPPTQNGDCGALEGGRAADLDKSAIGARKTDIGA